MRPLMRLQFLERQFIGLLTGIVITLFAANTDAASTRQNFRSDVETPSKPPCGRTHVRCPKKVFKPAAMKPKAKEKRKPAMVKRVVKPAAKPQASKAAAAQKQ